MNEEAMKPYRLLKDDGSKYFGESWDKAERPAQDVSLIDEGKTALDKMAENERELGIQMEPEQLKPADGQLIWVALAFIAFMLTLLTIRSCV